MNAVLWIFLALAFGLMLFVGLQENLPEELEVLRGEPVAEGYKAVNGWEPRQEKGYIEVKRKFFAPDVMVVGVLCTPQGLDLRIEPDRRIPPVATATVFLGNAAAQEWQRTAGSNLLPPDPRAVLRYALAQPQVQRITVKVGGNQRDTDVDFRGLADVIAQLPAHCSKL